MLAIHVHAQSFLTNGLVAYYPFNGNANDASGNGSNAAVINAVLCNDRFGYTNDAYLFNGSTSWLQTTNFWPVLGTNAASVSCWINYNGGVPQPYAESTMLSWGGDSVTFGSRFEFRLSDGGNGVTSMCLDGGGNASVAQTSIPANQWIHLVLVKPQNGGLNDTMFYVNGAPVPTTQQSDNVYKFNIVPTNTLTIGRGQLNDYAAAGRVFNGAIDDVRIYNVSLSPSQVTQIYQAESAQFVTLNKAVWLSFSNLRSGTNYQVQVSSNLNGAFSNYGSPFTATNSTMNYPVYWNVSDWSQLFFRLQALP